MRTCAVPRDKQMFRTLHSGVPRILPWCDIATLEAPGTAQEPQHVACQGLLLGGRVPKNEPHIVTHVLGLFRVGTEEPRHIGLECVGQAEEERHAGPALASLDARQMGLVRFREFRQSRLRQMAFQPELPDTATKLSAPV